MNYIYFSEWWEGIVFNDKIYLEKNEENMYGIIMCFQQQSLYNFTTLNNINKLDIINLRPIYPWDKKIIKHLNYFLK